MLSSQEKEKFLHTQLVKYGINYHKAEKVAKILANGYSDETLTEEEIQLTQEVCREWLKKHKLLSSILREYSG